MERFAVLVAGGSGTRMGAAVPKQFLPLPSGRPILVETFRAFASLPEISLIVVLPQDHLEYWKRLCREHGLPSHPTVAGGRDRTASVQAGLELVPDEALVAIHDGVRPFVTADLIEAAFATAQNTGAACACVPSKDSLRRRSADGSTHAVPRDEFFLVQTPQAFKAALWKQAFIKTQGTSFTDDASMVEAAGFPVALVAGSYANIKITTPEDLD